MLEFINNHSLNLSYLGCIRMKLETLVLIVLVVRAAELH